MHKHSFVVSMHSVVIMELAYTHREREREGGGGGGGRERVRERERDIQHNTQEHSNRHQIQWLRPLMCYHESNTCSVLIVS